MAFSGPMRRAAMLVLIVACQREKIVPPAERVSCLDLQLQKRGLNTFGDPEGTVYAGGTPLFDEKTGKSTDRAEYIKARHPDIAALCGPDR